jgi:3-hydroxybutyryl-CoA dehydrogenase
MEIKTFGVVGSGQMGNGIAQVAAMSGLNVIMNDISEEFVNRGLATITKNLDRSVEKGKMSKETRDATLGRIKKSTDIKDMANADYVVEAATEKEDLKFGIFKNLDSIC